MPLGTKQHTKPTNMCSDKNNFEMYIKVQVQETTILHIGIRNSFIYIDVFKHPTLIRVRDKITITF